MADAEEKRLKIDSDCVG